MRPKRGFTLIEILIYTAIMGSIFVSSVFITRAMYDTRARIRSSVILEENMRFALARIMSEVREADGVSEPVSSTGTTLTLIMNDPAHDPTVISLADGVITMSKGGNPAAALTSSEAEITSLVFTRSEGDFPLIRAELGGRMRNAAGPYQATLTLWNSAAIRR
jgi:prepilin-type N-terminal cleavage/methylation domain-containing protein